MADGTLIISGSTTYTGPLKSTTGVPPGLLDTRDALKIRLNPDLTFFSPWVQIYGFLADDGSTKIVQAPAGPDVFGSYYAFGFSNSVPIGTSPNYNFCLVVLASDGDAETFVTYSGTSGNEILSSVAPQTTAFLLGGLLSGATTDFYLAEATLPDPLLGYRMKWEKSLAMNLGTNLSGHTAVTKAIVGGGYLVLGEENGFGGNQNWVLTKVSDNGSLAWSQPIVYGGEGSDGAGAVKELADGRVVIIGTMRTGRPDAGEYKMTLVKVNREGKFEN
jgi:hypothetical protein